MAKKNVKDSVLELLNDSNTPTAKSSSKTPIIKNHKVENEIKEFRKLNILKKDLEAKLEILKGKIVSEAIPYYKNQNGKVGSFKFQTIDDLEIATIMFKNQFKVLDYDSELFEIPNFSTFFEEFREIKLKSTSNDTLALLIEKLGKEKVSELFDIKRKIKSVEDLNELQFADTMTDKIKNYVTQTVAIKC